MAGRSASSAKKSATKKIDGKTKEELQWEIRVCQTAIEKKNEDIKRTYHPLRVGLGHFGRAFLFFLPLVAISFIAHIASLWDAHPFGRYDFSDIELYTMAFLPLFLTALCIELLVAMFLEKKELVKQGSVGKTLACDVIEVLSERLRIARLTLLANETNAQVDEAETKFYLSFADLQKKCCINCAYVGEMIKTTTTKYSDGTTSQSSRREYFFCSKLSDTKVERRNVCNEFVSQRVAGAFNKAQKLFEETEAKLLEQESRSSVGFR